MVSIAASAKSTDWQTPTIPAKASTRRPTLVRKRNDTDLGNGADTTPQSPGKRAKVSFDEDVQIRIMGDWEKTPEFIRDEVRRALEKHALGDDTYYDRVREMYITKPTAEDAPTPNTLRNYTAALLAHVSTLNRSYSGLVHAILKSEWLGRDETYTLLFMRFLGTLVSAQGVYLGDVLKMLVENLTIAPPSSGRLPQQPTMKNAQIHHRAHMVLGYLLRLVPSAISVLMSILTRLFPHSSDSKGAHVVYIKNLLCIVDYAPEIRAEILALITERLVKIDVQIQVDLEDLADDVGDGLVQNLPKLHQSISDEVEFEEEESDDESDLSDEEIDLDAQRAKNITVNVEKLDLILEILFSCYTPLFSGTSIEVREAGLDTLLSQFSIIILPTYRSRHTQFLLFHFAQTSPALIDNFVGACVHIAFDKGRPSIIRQSAAAYLASFVARGMHVPSQIVRDVFDYIGSQLDFLRTENEATCRGPDLRRYSNYYSLVQALLYIFCFRWRDLQASPDEQADDDDILPITEVRDHIWIPGIKETLAQNVFSRFNPLKVCSPVIVAQFAKIANHLGLIYVFHLLETNKRIRLSQFSGSAQRNTLYSQPERETALSARKEESFQQLDEYFPFDPYHLPRSKKWLEGDYREWNGVPGLDEDKGGSGSEDSSESESEDEEEVVSDESSVLS